MFVGIYFFWLVLAFVVSASDHLNQQNPRQADYLAAELRASDDSSQFEVQIALLSRSGKECTLQSYDANAPFKLSLDTYSHLIVRGKSGRGKLGIRYRVNNVEKRAFEYLDAGEAVLIEFRPSGFSGAGAHWYEGKGWPFAPLVYTALKKE